MKHLLWLVLLAAGPAWADTGAPRPVVSEIVELQRADAAAYVGTVTARIEADLGFPLLGTVAARPVDRGDLVAVGDTLAQLDPEELEADRRAAEAGIIMADAQLRSARDARDRAEALVARAVDSETRLEDAERALAGAEAQMEQAEATLAQARDRLKDATLTAPHDGVITEIHAEPGATLSAGEPVLRLAATDRLEVEIDVTERDLARLAPGTPFDVSLIAQPDLTARATLDRIDPEADRSTRTRRVHLALADPPGGFRLGALVRVRPARDAASGVSLPLAAILAPGDAPAVWVVDRANDRVVRRPVTLGARLGEQVQITGGLAPGEEVVLKGIHSLKDGQAVGPQVQP
ncbi:efflux RND transporter periplasmic adaptor subunit [Rhodovulum euryhalinum]|uniref:RND family efflux transporter MFP subunit n=1 Tax=Rhodovulum euryhalinum TaxID=35805 RepID=A0A4R2KB63_9RHOB|nr:efflux RND transporter periplasmic adaptor subunit [Rhodovulum euryhalinum]TCO69452.1 RND family efflux transporter MFP subunit [Rhodovulum euryhalinum]